MHNINSCLINYENLLPAYTSLAGGKKEVLFHRLKQTYTTSTVLIFHYLEHV